MNAFNLQHPTHLIIGPNEQAIMHIEQEVIAYFCPQKGVNCFCHECRKIKQRQHSNYIVITPEKNYTIDDLEVIFEKTKFAMDDGALFFFVLESAHLLTASTANRLLKTLEEPPAGYRFFLLTPKLEAVLPTIVSRCLVTTLEQTSILGTTHPLLEYFLDPKRYDPLSFEADLKKYALTEADSVELVYSLLFKNQHNESASDFLRTCLRRPPQAGSTEIFWKNLFLNFPRT